MKRRDVLKGISLSALGLAGLNPQVKAAELADEVANNKDPEFKQFGRTEYEKMRDAKLFAEQFFNPHEMKTISILVDIIIPRDERSGSATEAGVPEFIEFMAKDKPDFQTPLRGGLGWIDNEAQKRFGKVFVDITPAQRIEIVEDIAYPERKKPGMSHGVAFFTLMRNLTASGFWSSKIGIADIGYQGNTPNTWDGVPEEVLKQYGLG
ncbi:MAG: gluconate 2-dehydrogenase subunit 3 family protein [Chitinophagales bacterium]|nr:gluconate 2-dehydrogenase subunit 3 family protein [Chitinophagales bacterium]